MAVQDLDFVPERSNGVVAYPSGDGLIVKWRLIRKGVRLNETGKAIWSLCDGETPVAAMLTILARDYRTAEGTIRQDVIGTLENLERRGLLSLRRVPRKPAGARTLDLRDMPLYVINCNPASARRESMRRQLSDLGLRFEFIEGVVSEPRFLGVGISHLKVLADERIEPPFGVLEDDCVFNENFRYEFTIPAETDAFYLGVSGYGIETPGEFGPAIWRGVQWTRHDDTNLRVFNMLSRHAILYLSEAFRRAAKRASLAALTHNERVYHGDVGVATTHPDHLVLTPLAPICHQSAELDGDQVPTENSLMVL